MSEDPSWLQRPGCREELLVSQVVLVLRSVGCRVKLQHKPGSHSYYAKVWRMHDDGFVKPKVRFRFSDHPPLPCLSDSFLRWFDTRFDHNPRQVAQRIARDLVEQKKLFDEERGREQA